jgi:hypothetical protein
MENNNVSFLKTDDNKIINEKCIRWVKKMEECLQVCMKSDGCEGAKDTHKICKETNPISYKKLYRHW